jgi:hypothetical protein
VSLRVVNGATSAQLAKLQKQEEKVRQGMLRDQALNKA